MQIQCPKCQTAIETADVAAGSEVTCPKCGSRVNSAEATQDELEMTCTYATIIEDPAVVQPIRLTADEQSELQVLFRPGVACKTDTFWIGDSVAERWVTCGWREIPSCNGPWRSK